MAELRAALRGMLEFWPAVGVPVLIVSAVVVVLQQQALSQQLISVRRDVGMLTAEVGKLRQELGMLRNSQRRLSEEVKAIEIPAPAPVIKPAPRPRVGQGGRSHHGGRR
ncbi:MAG TPA: hypothetical protein ENK18_24845 [Deltaproteobacteria bacterium]|nr:hypothetical protein [Deltaproteobacteria bacterium]